MWLRATRIKKVYIEVTVRFKIEVEIIHRLIISAEVVQSLIDVQEQNTGWLQYHKRILNRRDKHLH